MSMQTLECVPAMPREPYVNPDYYRRGSIEVIEIIEAYELTYCLASALKYILRCGHKGNPIEDVEKALWFLKRELRQRTKNAIPRKGAVSSNEIA